MFFSEFLWCFPHAKRTTPNPKRIPLKFEDDHENN